MSDDNKISIGKFSSDPEKSIIDVRISRKIPDGVYAWVELDGLGHAFWSIHIGNKIVVYTYGRYDDVDTIPITGEGVLIKYTDGLAISYIKKKLYLENGYCNVYKINDADPNLAKEYSDKLWFSSNEKPDREQTYKEIRNHGRVINTYNLFIRNCVTNVIDALEISGSNIFFDFELDPISPYGLFIQLDMKSQTNKNVTKFTDYFKLVIKKD